MAIDLNKVNSKYPTEIILVVRRDLEPLARWKVCQVLPGPELFDITNTLFDSRIKAEQMALEILKHVQLEADNNGFVLHTRFVQGILEGPMPLPRFNKNTDYLNSTLQLFKAPLADKAPDT